MDAAVLDSSVATKGDLNRTASSEIRIEIAIVLPTITRETPVEICTHGSASIFAPMNMSTMASPSSR